MDHPRIALLIVGDGRDALRLDMAESFGVMAQDYELACTIEVDDRDHALGFCGAIREGWARLAAVSRETPFDYVWHAEEDWLYLHPFSVQVMASILNTDGDLAQIALKRGPHGSEPEGGFMAAWPELYHEVALIDETGEHPFLRHEAFFTTNPSLYPATIIERAWPEAPACEERFGRALFADGWSCAYLGRLGDLPMIQHTGERTGTAY